MTYITRVTKNNITVAIEQEAPVSDDQIVTAINCIDKYCAQKAVEELTGFARPANLPDFDYKVTENDEPLDRSAFEERLQVSDIIDENGFRAYLKRMDTAMKEFTIANDQQRGMIICLKPQS